MGFQIKRIILVKRVFNPNERRKSRYYICTNNIIGEEKRARIVVITLI